jgi:hypothetical protein
MRFHLRICDWSPNFATHLPDNRALTEVLSAKAVTATNLRRLREHGLIERIPHTHRYRVTSTSLRHAMFLTHVHDRILNTGLAELTGPNPAPAQSRHDLPGRHRRPHPASKNGRLTRPGQT